jgi:predicted RNA-binding Zn-ribbon protein involved in translation (DUF1610 family)
MIFVTGLVLMIIGGCMFASGLRGRLLNAHPHCRGCGFDLHGIELVSGTRCPECGRLISTGGSSVRIGRRKKNPTVVVLGVLLTLIGTGGVSYPLWSQIPTWKNINWYEHLPESMLINMTIKGNKDARFVINDRLIPGEVNEDGLATLIDHAMTLLDDESVPWDEWWGDVLLYALVHDLMNDDQTMGYMQRALQFKISMREHIGMDTTQGKYHIQSESGSRGKWSYAFQMELARATHGASSFNIDSPYRLRVEKRVRSEVMRSDQWVDWIDSDEFTTPRKGWVPFEFSTMFGYSSNFALPRDIGEFNFEFELRVKVEKLGQPLYAWEIVEQRRVIRVESPVYVHPVSASESQQIAESISWLTMELPNGIEEYRDHFALRSLSPRMLTVRSSEDTQAGLIGDIWIDNGTTQLRLGSIRNAGFQSRSSYGFSFPLGRALDHDESWIDAYLRDWEFWHQAINNQRVDVIYRPDGTLGRDDVQIDRFVNHPIVWEGVKVIETHPTKSSGNMRLAPSFEPETEAERAQHAKDLAGVPGRLLIEP